MVKNPPMMVRDRGSILVGGRFHVPGQLSPYTTTAEPAQFRTVPGNREGTAMKSLGTVTREQYHLPRLENAYTAVKTQRGQT